MPAPEKPATTPSLPGANSTRTDGGIASKQAQRYISGMPNYGDGAEMMNLQAQAPMAATPDVKPMPAADIAQAGQSQPAPTPAPQEPLPSLTGISNRPWEHVTTPHPIQTNADVQGQYQTAYSLFNNMASQPDASPTMRYLAERIGQAF
jgi:hypothetical protein